MSYAQKAVNQAIIVFLFAMLAALIGYFIRLYLAHTLGTEGYGLFYAGIAFVSFLMLIIGLGTSGSLQKFIAEYKAKKNLSGIKAIINTVFLVQLSTYLIVGMVIILFSKLLAQYYFHSRELYSLLILFVLLLFFIVLEIFYKHILIGFQKPHYFTFLTFVRNILILFFTAVFFVKTRSVNTAVLAFIVSYLAAFLCFIVIFLLKIFPEYTKKKAQMDHALFKRIIKYGLSVMLIMVGGKVITYTDTIMMGFFRTISEVGIYQAALPTAEVMRIIPEAFAFVLTPMAASLLAKEKRKEVVKLYELIQKYFFVIIIPIAFILVFYAPLVLRILFGDDFEAGSTALAVLAIANLFFTITLINNSLFHALERPQIISRFMLIAAGINIVANVILIPPYGIEGAAVATLLSFVFVLFMSSKEISKQKVRLPYYGWIKGMLAGLLFTLFLLIVKDYLMINKWYIEAPLVLGMGLVFYSVVVILLRAIKVSEIEYIFRVFVLYRLKNAGSLLRRFRK